MKKTLILSIFSLIIFFISLSFVSSICFNGATSVNNTCIDTNNCEFFLNNSNPTQNLCGLAPLGQSKYVCTETCYLDGYFYCDIDSYSYCAYGCYDNIPQNATCLNSPYCNNECDSPELLDCKNISAMRICTEDVEGCLAWENIPCASGQSCSYGVCGDYGEYNNKINQSTPFCDAVGHVGDLCIKGYYDTSLYDLYCYSGEVHTCTGGCTDSGDHSHCNNEVYNNKCFGSYNLCNATVVYDTINYYCVGSSYYDTSTDTCVEGCIGSIGNASCAVPQTIYGAHKYDFCLGDTNILCHEGYNTFAGDVCLESKRLNCTFFDENCVQNSPDENYNYTGSCSNQATCENPECTIGQDTCTGLTTYKICEGYTDINDDLCTRYTEEETCDSGSYCINTDGVITCETGGDIYEIDYYAPYNLQYKPVTTTLHVTHDEGILEYILNDLINPNNYIPHGSFLYSFTNAFFHNTQTRALYINVSEGYDYLYQTTFPNTLYSADNETILFNTTFTVLTMNDSNGEYHNVIDYTFTHNCNFIETQINNAIDEDITSSWSTYYRVPITDGMNINYYLQPQHNTSIDYGEYYENITSQYNFYYSNDDTYLLGSEESGTYFSIYINHKDNQDCIILSDSVLDETVPITLMCIPQLIDNLTLRLYYDGNDEYIQLKANNYLSKEINFEFYSENEILYNTLNYIIIYDRFSSENNITNTIENVTSDNTLYDDNSVIYLENFFDDFSNMYDIAGTNKIRLYNFCQYEIVDDDLKCYNTRFYTGYDNINYFNYKDYKICFGYNLNNVPSGDYNPEDNGTGSNAWCGIGICNITPQNQFIIALSILLVIAGLTIAFTFMNQENKILSMLIASMGTMLFIGFFIYFAYIEFIPSWLAFIIIIVGAIIAGLMVKSFFSKNDSGGV